MGMAEYIEREKIREEYEKLTRSYVRNDPYIADWRFYEMIESLPAADVAPVRHGEWIVCGDGNNVPWMCSHCGKTITRKFKMMYGKYCPNCGAKMDSEE